MAVKAKKKAAPKAKGIVVELAVFGGGSPMQFRMKKAATLGAFKSAHVPKAVNLDQYEVRVNDRARNDDYILNDQDQITLAPVVAGGSL